ncbi:hypothetical protein HDV05_000847, partial [Chytridiales sp. JEL 0842]
IFLRTAESIESKRDLADQVHVCYHSFSFIYFALGDFAKAEKFYQLSLTYYTNRDDKHNIIAANGIFAEFGFWKGDLQGPLKVIEGTLDRSMLKTSPVWAVFNAGFAARIFLVQGDTRQSQNMVDLLEFYVANLPPIGSYKGYPLIMNIPKSWLAYQLGHYKEAVRCYSIAAEYFQYVFAVGGITVDMLVFGAFLTWLLLAESDAVNTTNGEARTVMTTSLKDGCNRLMKKSKSWKRVIIVRWALVLYQAAELLISKKKEKAVAWIIRHYNDPTRARQLDTFPMMKAFVLAILGRFHSNGPLAISFTETAITYFHNFGALYMVDWCKKKP